MAWKLPFVGNRTLLLSMLLLGQIGVTVQWMVLGATEDPAQIGDALRRPFRVTFLEQLVARVIGFRYSITAQWRAEVPSLMLPIGENLVQVLSLQVCLMDLRSSAGSCLVVCCLLAKSSLSSKSNASVCLSRFVRTFWRNVLMVFFRQKTSLVRIDV